MTKRKPRNLLKMTGESVKYHSEFRIWCSMRSRCNNPRYASFVHYGARGIKVCEKWSSFKVFIEEMGPRPSRAHSIERVDNNKGYSIENCRWALREEQANNTRRNIFLHYNGEKMTISQWANRIGIKVNTLQYRLRRGWSTEKALSIKPRLK